MRHEKYSMYLGNMNMRLIKFVIIPTLVLCIVMYPAKALAVELHGSMEDSIEQEESLLVSEESVLDPEEPTSDLEVSETDMDAVEETIVQEIIVDNSDLINAISESRDDICRTILFGSFLIVGCMAAYIVWRFKV